MKLDQKQIEEVRKLFSEYAKKNYLKNESDDNSEFSYEIYTDYQDINNVEDFVLSNARLSKQKILEKLYDNFYDNDIDFNNNQYYFAEFIKEYMDELENIKNENIKFKHVKELMECKTFNDFEKENEDIIFYADGDEKSVIKALNDCEIDLTNHLDFYYFDNWSIALYKY